MSTAASLMVNLLANTGQFGPPLDEARRKLEQTFKPPGSIGELAHSLHGLQQQMAGFNSVIELGFGMRIGRQVFEKVHEGIVEMIKGFGDASTAGGSFFGSFEEGLKHAMGVHTLAESLEGLNKALDANKAAIREVDDGIVHLIEHLKLGNDIVAGGLLFSVDKSFSGLKPEAQSAFQAERHKIEEARKKILEQTSNDAMQKAALAPTGPDFMMQVAMNLTGNGDKGPVADMARKQRILESDQTRRQAELRQRDKALEELGEREKKAEQREAQEKALLHLKEIGAKLMKEGEEYLAKQMHERAEDLKHDQAEANRMRVADDALVKLKQEAAEAERLHNRGLLTDNELNLHLAKLKQEAMVAQQKEQKNKGWDYALPDAKSHAVEAGSMEAYEELTTWKAGSGHAGVNNQVDLLKSIDKTLREMKGDGKDKNGMKDVGLAALDVIASIL